MGLANGFDAAGVRDTEAYDRASWGLDEPARPDDPEPVPEAEPAFRSELTLEGEQLVIPGCERNRARVADRLDRFG